MKNLDAEILERMNVPARHPKVLTRKYRLVAYPAWSRVMAALSCKIFGAVMLMPTSIPTFITIPMKSIRILPIPSMRKQSENEDALSPVSCSFISVTASQARTAMSITAKMTKSNFQSPSLMAA